MCLYFRDIRKARPLNIAHRFVFILYFVDKHIYEQHFCYEERSEQCYKVEIKNLKLIRFCQINDYSFQAGLFHFDKSRSFSK